jgi:hypothetical protein
VRAAPEAAANVRPAPAAAAQVGWCALASALSIGALALAGSAPAAFGDRSLIGLCALPWLALAGLPRLTDRARPIEQTQRAPRAPGCDRVLAALLAIGPLLVALRVELARAPDWRWPLAHAAAAWLAVLALEQVAHAAAASGARARALHALAWCAFVPGVPWLAWSFELGGAPAPQLVRELARASPLRLGWSAAASDALALALPLGLLALAWAAQRASARARAAFALCCAFGASCALAATAAAGEQRIAFARIAIEGPLSEIAIESEGVRTVLAHEWLAGEAEELELPLGAGAAPPPGEPLARVEPRLTTRGAGRARVLAGSEERAQAWSSLPAGLRARGAPPLAGAHVRASLAALCALAALACALLALRRNARAALALAGLGGLFAAGLPPAGARGAAQCVVDVQHAAPAWIERRSAIGELAVPLERWVRFELEPPAAPCELRLERGPSAGTGRAESGGRAWSVRARAQGEARLDAWHVHALAAGAGPQLLELARWEELWLRSADGNWRAATELLQSSARTPAGPRAASPPGWLATGLPQGRSALLGRAGSAGGGALGGAGSAAAGEVWLRWVGYEPP